METSQQKLTFLDIQIFIKSDGSIGSTLFGKPSAGNSLLHATSSHPAPLIANVPYGQYLRLKRNCSEHFQFEQEAKALQICLRQQGYSKKCLKRPYLKAKNQDKSTLIHVKKKPKANVGVRLITRFSGQHQQVRDILKKYWYLLMGDGNVSKHLKEFPEITYKRSRSLRDKFVHSHYAPQQAAPDERKGTRPCHKCNYCRHIYASRHILLSDGRMYKPKFLATCQSIGIVYIMICDCDVFYVSKTKQPFFHRIRDHVSLVGKRKMETPISRHMGLYHNVDDSKMHFFALEHVPPNERGGDNDNILLQHEARWISDLDALRHPGLNDALNFKSFLYTSFFYVTINFICCTILYYFYGIVLYKLNIQRNFIFLYKYVDAGSD